MPPLLIRKLEGDFENVLVRDVKTQVAAHIQIPVAPDKRRVVVAMPAGKAALCFETAEPAAWALEGDPVPFQDPDGQGGVLFTLATTRDDISIPVPSVLLNHTLMARFGIDHEQRNGRRFRELIDSGRIRDIESALGIALHDLTDRGQTIGPAIDAERSTITFTRRALDGKHRYRLEFHVDRALDVREAGDCVRISRKSPSAAAPLRLTVRASTDFARFTPMPCTDLLNERGLALLGTDKHFAEALRNFEFLSYEEKYLAGSWNFLSYFGRDTLIALRMMWPVLSERAKRAGIQSVANEISDDGIVNVTDEWTDDRTVADAIECFFRDYDQGNLDGARHLMTTIVEGTVPEHPFLDVLDQTFMFPSAAAHWFNDVPDGELKAWLEKEHPVLGRRESNRVTLLRNWNYVLKAAAPCIAAWSELCAKHPGVTPRQIIERHADEFRGTYRCLVHSIAGAANWRDTYNLPWHFRAEDINVNLLPMAIAAIQEMIGRIGAMDGLRAMIDAARTHSLHVVDEYLGEPGRFDAARAAWNWDVMREHYLVRRTVDEMRRDLERYLDGLKNGDVFGWDRDRGIRERDALLRCRERGTTVSEFLAGTSVPDSVKDGIEFTALFLDTDGRPIPLMQSDDVYLLLFGTPTIGQFRRIVRPFVLSYPFGLGFFDDDIGIAVTNAVYSPRDNDALKDASKNVWVKFGPDEYHGRGCWPWVLFALIGGTRNQALKGIHNDGRLADGVTFDDVDLFRTILAKSKSSIAKLGPLATSEVFRFTPATPADGIWQAAPMGISTPIQLWSAAPANMLIDEALARIDLAGHR